MPPNGVEVRGLRILRVTEHDRWTWRSVVDVVMGLLPSADESHTLVVTTGPGDVVASRRFTSRIVADRARSSFVAKASDMSDETFARADWQALLDRL